MKLINYLNIALMAAVLTACGGGSGNNSSGTPSGNGGTTPSAENTPDDTPISLVSEDNKTMMLSLRAMTTGNELWTTDGTEEGTTLIKDINKKDNKSYMNELVTMKSIVYFQAQSSTYGLELWRSDGTEVGTYVLKDIWEGSYGSDPKELTVVGNTLYFIASDSTHGRRLWKSDGTKEGTTMIDKAFALSYRDRPARILHLTKVGDTLFFTANDGVHGHELWKSDGTSAGTQMVKDINEGEAGHFQAIHSLTMVENRLYFVVKRDAKDARFGQERDLWTSDGTESGTHKVQGFPSDGAYDQFYYLKNIENSLYCVSKDYVSSDKKYTLWHVDTNGAVAMQKYDGVYGVVDLNGKAYFFARTLRAEKWKFWKSNGTASGTVKVLERDFNRGAQGLKSVDGTLYFFDFIQETIDDVVTNYIEQWKSDGTEGNTTLVRKLENLYPYPISTVRVKLGDKLLLTAYDEQYGIELWIGGGEKSNSTLLKDITEGSKSSDLSKFINVNGTVYFRAQVYGDYQLWKTDGTPEGTVRVEGIDTGTADANPQKLVQMKGDYYFIANDGVHGNELWKSDGTEVGTSMVVDAVSGNEAHTYGLKGLQKIKNEIYFDMMTREGKKYSYQLWKSDGTTEGSVKIKGFPFTNYKEREFRQTQYFDINGTVLFRGHDKEHGFELWSTDGTEAGTKLFLDIDKNETSSMPRHFVEINDQLYFTAFDSATSISLWKSDGTVAGTKQLLALPEGYDNKQYGYKHRGGPMNLTDVNGTLFFTMNVDKNNTELWKSDGTKAGTVALKRFKKRWYLNYPFGLTNVNGELYFVPVYYNNSSNKYGWELWKSDGTEKGTTLVSHVGKGKYSSYYRMGQPTYFKGNIYFSMPDDELGTELWMSDGTTEGTKLFKDFKKGNESSFPNIRGVLDENLIFEATDDRGRKLWKTDGTVEGTEMVKDGLN